MKVAKVLLCDWERLSETDRLDVMAGRLFPGREYYDEVIELVCAPGRTVRIAVRRSGPAALPRSTQEDGQSDEDVCERVFEHCQNIDLPWRTPPCRSFSMSDCVEIDGRLYYCMTVGFKQLPDGDRRVI